MDAAQNTTTKKGGLAMFNDYQVMRYHRNRNAVFVDIHSFEMDSNIELRFSFLTLDAACRFEHDIKERFQCNFHFRIESIIELYKWIFKGGM